MTDAVFAAQAAELVQALHSGADPASAFAQARDWHRQGQLAAAGAVYAAILAQQPEYADALHLRGVLHLQQGAPGEAVTSIERALHAVQAGQQAQSSLFAIHCNLGNAYAASGQPQAALAQYDAALALQPDLADAHYNRGNALLALGQPAAAVDSYAQAFHLRPEYADPCQAAALCLFGQQRWQEALPWYERWLQLRPEQASGWNDGACCLIELRRAEEALAWVDRALALQPAWADALNNRGNALLLLQRPAEALTAYTSALELAPEFMAACNNQGNAYLALRQFAPALACFDRALAADAGSAVGRAELVNNRGAALQGLERAEEALACHEEALRLHPDYPLASFNRGNALLALRRWPEALASFDAALAAQPEYADAWYNRANALEALERYSESVSSFEQVLRLKPDNPEALNRLGNALLRLQRREEAVAAFRRALAHGGDPEPLRYALACLGEEEAPPVSPRNYVVGLFDQYAERFDSHLTQVLGYDTPARLTASLRRQLAEGGSRPLPWAAIDLGCGTGLCGEGLRGLCSSLIGVDLSPKMLTQAARREVYSALVEADVASFLADQPSASADLVLAADVFIYIGELAGIFAEVARLLRPAGMFAFSVEVTEAADYLLLPTRRYAQSHAYVQRLATAHGLTLLECTPQVIRMEVGVPVAGEHWLLRRQG